MPPTPRFLAERSIAVGARSRSAKVERFGFDSGGAGAAIGAAGATGRTLTPAGFLTCLAECFMTGLGTGLTTTLPLGPSEPLFAVPLACGPAPPPAPLGVGAGARGGDG